MKSFVPQGFYSKYVGTSTYDILINDKILFHDLMNAYGLPCPKLFFVFRNNIFYKDNRVVSDEVINSIINGITDKRIFVKRYRGGGGSGIFIFSKTDTGYYDKNNERLSAEHIREKYNNVTLLFEKQIIQEPILASFNPDTVNTLRVQVIKDKKNKDKIISAAVRFGKKGGFIDNASQGGIVVSLDIEKGVLGEYGVKKYDMNKYYSHPDTNISFSGVEVNQWDEVKSLVYKTLDFLPYYRGIGFDIATTDQGPVIIEINTGAAMDAPQLGKEKGIAEHFC